MIDPQRPALVLAPMDGITDAPMRALQGEFGAFTYSVSEFVRVSGQALPPKVFRRAIPELSNGALTETGLPVQVQILGGSPELMARTAEAACSAGATAIDINFGCPAPTVNRHDGGASLLNHPCRIRDIVRAVRSAVRVPVSAKLRLGWDNIESIHENAAMASEGGASWLTIHARTRMQNYAPPVYWKPIGQVREALGVPVIANGDICSMDDFRRCRDETGCTHFMIGRGALANPNLSHEIAAEIGIGSGRSAIATDWISLLEALVTYSEMLHDRKSQRTVMRLKQWLRIAARFGDFREFDAVKEATTVEELLVSLRIRSSNHVAICA